MRPRWATAEGAGTSTRRKVAMQPSPASVYVIGRLVQTCNSAHTLRTVMREAVVGIDVGGTRIKAAMVTPSGEVLAETVRPTLADVGPQLGEIAGKAVVDLTAVAVDAVDVLAVVSSSPASSTKRPASESGRPTSAGASSTCAAPSPPTSSYRWR